MSRENNFVYPKDVDAFGFDWGRLSLTVAPETNGAKRFSGGVVDLPSGQGHSRHNHPGAEEIIFVISGHGEQMVIDLALQESAVDEHQVLLAPAHAASPNAAWRSTLWSKPRR